MSEALLTCRGLTVYYGPVVGLRDVDLNVAKGELVAVIGANGAGKSSLLKGVMRLARATGTVYFNGRDLSHSAPHRLTRAGVALVPERRQVFPSLTVEENLLIGASALRRRDRRDALAHTYDAFPLLRERRSQLAGTLSGGQQQLVAIGRAVISRPKLCLLDEPSLGLAPVWVDEVFAHINALRNEGMTLVVVEQLASVVLAVADRGYVLERGRVQLEGPASELLGHPEVARRYLGVVDHSVAS
mgnify:CR=1 FL=1